MSFGSVLSIGSFASIVSVLSALSRAGVMTGGLHPRSDADTGTGTSAENRELPT
jgi:hypothetical protein